jgi:hypothetical protein
MSPAHEIEEYEEMEVELHASSALDGSGQLSRSGRFIAEVRAPGTHRRGVLTAPRACLEALNTEIVPRQKSNHNTSGP